MTPAALGTDDRRRVARALLEVDATASEQEVRRAWRIAVLGLRSRHGSDTAPGYADDFRQLREAFELLQPSRAPTPAPSSSPTDPRSTRGADLTGEVDVPFLVWASGGGTTVILDFPRHGRRRIDVVVPAGVHSGWTRRYPKMGGAGDPAGDLILVIRGVLPDPRFRVDGLDLRTSIRVDLADVVEGAVVVVELPSGRRPVQLQRGQLGPVRVRGEGLRRGVVVGDALVELEVAWPSPTPALLQVLRSHR